MRNNNGQYLGRNIRESQYIFLWFSMRYKLKDDDIWFSIKQSLWSPLYSTIHDVLWVAYFRGRQGWRKAAPSK